ncbi:uncharacterized protein EHS24_000954 [Apiotrichum porosum]|uniref:SGNH hydrolase-type esterase domain-containing protein n=1 Tax=Apiotrichum porosum TaxID=105984 RepID=A0A427YBA7_9TREE|nr:uncharacterized protein EHS24_000954 [Apiotrichum porosum]RSH88410.1 hypothetical protein EHS24_000954 [Apiotrichum porosum]
MRWPLLLTLVLQGAHAAPSIPPSPPPGLPGTFVPFSRLHECPPLQRRNAVPSSADDVRPDDITVVMAMGDSITAAFLAKSGGWAIGSGGEIPSSWRREADGQAVFATVTPDAEEFRGVSYAAGGDAGAITLPNILAHYNPNVTGAATGHHPPVSCGLPGMSRVCTPHSDDDRLNAAISGSVAAALVGQARDYLLPTYEETEKQDGWAFLNIGIGANDICAFCLSSTLPFGPGSPEEFVQGIRDAVQLVRNHVPKLIVNIMGVLRVSAIYKLTLTDPYCQGPLPFPHISVECSCALIPGLVGDFTRWRMDNLAEAYDTAVLELIREWEAEDDSTFAAVWQPGSAFDLEHYPITALSPADCFHPSEAAHARIAAGVWNRLTMDPGEKAIPVKWEEEVMVRCLEADDRINIRQPR